MGIAEQNFSEFWKISRTKILNQLFLFYLFIVGTIFIQVNAKNSSISRFLF